MNTFNRMILLCCLSFCSFLSAMDINKQLINAAEAGNCEQVQILLNANASVGARDEHGWTPLHWAACKGHEAIARLLLEYGASVDTIATDGALSFGWTPLQCAVISDRLRTAALILSNPLLSNPWAAQNGNKAVEKLLRLWPIYQKLVKNSPKKKLAFCCAQHPRLGGQSLAQALPNELFYVICKSAKPTIEDADKETKSWRSILINFFHDVLHDVLYYVL